MIPPSMPFNVSEPTAPLSPVGSVQYHPDEIAAAVALAGECYTEACRRIKADIDAAMQEPASILRNQLAVVQGQIGNALDEAERAYLKNYVKVQSGARDALDRAYYAANNLGIPKPIDVAVKIGLESGTELASSYLREHLGELVMVGYPEELLGPEPYGLAQPTAPAAAQTGSTIHYCPEQVPGAPKVYPWPISADVLNGPNRDDYLAYLEWVLDLGPGWYPGIYSPGEIYPYMCNGVPEYQLKCHPNMRWFAYAGQFVCTDQNPPKPDPPVPPPPPPPPPPPTGGDSCPVPPPTATQCQLDTAADIFGRAYDLLTSKQKAAVDCLCAVKDGKAPNPGDYKPPEPAGAANLKLPNWCSPNIAAELQAFQSIAVDPARWLMGFLRLHPSEGNTYYVPPWLEWAKDATAIPHWLLKAFVDALIYGIQNLEPVIRQLNEMVGESTTANLFAETVYTILRGLNRIVGFPPASWLRSLEKTINWQVPEQIPGASEAIEGYLTGAFDKETSNAYIRGNGYCIDPQDKLRHARRTRPNIHEATQLFMQEKITEEEWRRKLRDMGVVERSEQDEYRKLVDSYPQPPDLVRFMMRDAADEEVVRKYQYDKDFEAKFTGDIKTYAKAVGLNEKEARLYWRAHWDTPSNTQAFEMLHRLRPGAVPKSIEVTAEDVRQLIQTNDMAPFWVERLMATSYHALTTTDVKEALFAGTLKEEQVKGAMQDVGYNERDAEEKAKALIRIKHNRLRSASGMPTARDWVNLYVEGLVNANELNNRLREMGWSVELVEATINGANTRRKIAMARAEVKGVKGQFKAGQLDREEAMAALAGFGYGPQEADYLTKLWSHERRSRSKVLTGAKLCKAWEYGLLTPEDYQKQLYASGYSIEDAKRIMAECGIDVATKQAKAAEARQRKEQAQAEKLKRELEKAEKKRCQDEQRRKKGQPPSC